MFVSSFLTCRIAGVSGRLVRSTCRRGVPFANWGTHEAQGGIIERPSRLLIRVSLQRSISLDRHSRSLDPSSIDEVFVASQAFATVSGDRSRAATSSCDFASGNSDSIDGRATPSSARWGRSDRGAGGRTSTPADLPPEVHEACRTRDLACEIWTFFPGGTQVQDLKGGRDPVGPRSIATPLRSACGDGPAAATRRSETEILGPFPRVARLASGVDSARPLVV